MSYGHNGGFVFFWVQFVDILCYLDNWNIGLIIITLSEKESNEKEEKEKEEVMVMIDAHFIFKEDMPYGQN